MMEPLSMYRYKVLAAMRQRPLEAMGGWVAMLRGAWAVAWPLRVHDHPVLEVLLNFGSMRSWGALVFLCGAAQLTLVFDKELHFWLRLSAVMAQLVSIGIITAAYLTHDPVDVATAFYISMWMTQVWVLGDIFYERRIRRSLDT